MASINRSQSASTVIKDRFLRWPEVQQRVGLCRSQCHALAAAGRFPKPFKLTPQGRASAWLESQIDAWVAERTNVVRGG